jgi:hypothetical protein
VPEGELGERGGSRADAEHVVRGHLLRSAVQAGRQVADDPQVGAVVAAVWAAVEPGGHLADRLREHAVGHEPLDQPGERPLRVGQVHRALEKEQPDQRRERLPGARWSSRNPTKCRGGLVARERRVRLRAEQLGNRVVGEVGGEQRVAERTCQRGVQRTSIFGDLTA